MLNSWAPAGARVNEEFLTLRKRALKAWTVALALLWAASAVCATLLPGTAGQPATGAPGVESAKLPSIQLLHTQTGLAGTCGGTAFNVNTFINVGTLASADVRLTVPSLGVVEQFTDETGKNIGPYNAKYSTFHIPAFGGGLAPNTPITITVVTYSGPALSGASSSTSTLSFNCTTGVVILAQAIADPIPTLSSFTLVAAAALIALLGAAVLRRRARSRAR